MKDTLTAAWCTVTRWKLSILRCLIYAGIVAWGVFKAGTNGFDGLDQMTPLQKIDLSGDMAAAFFGVVLAFLDNSISALSNQTSNQNPTDMTKKLAPVVAAAVLVAFTFFVLPGCTTTGQRTAANTIQSVEATGTAAYAAYCDGVLKGVIPTNDFPKASKAYNQFQADVALAVTLAQNNSNALAPTNLTTELGNLVNIFTTASKLSNTSITPVP